MTIKICTCTATSTLAVHYIDLGEYCSYWKMKYYILTLYLCRVVKVSAINRFQTIHDFSSHQASPILNGGSGRVVLLATGLKTYQKVHLPACGDTYV